MSRKSLVDVGGNPTLEKKEGLTVGQRIKAQRKKLELTQEKLAEMISSNKCTISHYEHDRVDIKLSTLRVLCDTLNMSPNYLMGYRDEGSDIADTYNRINSTDAKKIVKALVKILSE